MRIGGGSNRRQEERELLQGGSQGTKYGTRGDTLQVLCVRLAVVKKKTLLQISIYNDFRDFKVVLCYLLHAVYLLSSSSSGASLCIMDVQPRQQSAVNAPTHYGFIPRVR